MSDTIYGGINCCMYIGFSNDMEKNKQFPLRVSFQTSHVRYYLLKRNVFFAKQGILDAIFIGQIK